MADKTTPTVEEQLAAFAKQLADQNEVIASQNKTIASLTAKEKPVKKEALKTPTKLVKVDKKNYKFKVPHFYLDGKYIVSEDAALDNDILQKIVALPGQNILKEQV